MDEILDSIMMRTHPEAVGKIEEYLKTGVVPKQYETEGYSVQQLMTERGMNPIAALLTIGWLMQEPEIAKASLKKGSDHVY